MTDMDKAMHVPEDWKDPKYHYSWVTDDKKMQTEVKFDGYKHVKATDEDGKRFKDAEDPRVGIDGKIRIGDAILMKCPRSLVEDRKSVHKKRYDYKAMVRAVAEDFHSGAAALGVPSYEDPTSKKP